MTDYRKLIYVAGPYRAPTEFQVHQNVLRARRASEALLQMGVAPQCSHLNSDRMGGIVPDDQILENCVAWVRRCDAIYLLEGWWDSQGAVREMRVACGHCIPMFEDTPEGLLLLLRWLNPQSAEDAEGAVWQAHNDIARRLKTWGNLQAGRAELEGCDEADS